MLKIIKLPSLNSCIYLYNKFIKIHAILYIHQIPIRRILLKLSVRFSSIIHLSLMSKMLPLIISTSYNNNYIN